MSDNRLSIDDPALAAVNRMAEILDPFDRDAQLRILTAVCVTMNQLEYAQALLDELTLIRTEVATP